MEEPLVFDLRGQSVEESSESLDEEHSGWSESSIVWRCERRLISQMERSLH